MRDAGIFSDWLGQAEEASDQITPELCDRLRAVIDPVEGPSDSVPLGIHWCTALTTLPNREIGIDGHPAKGGFLPPIPYPNRMWASSELIFHDHFRVDDRIRRMSRIVDIIFKDGKSGPLCFVTLDHSWNTPRGIAITESQHIVYRPATIQSASRRESASAMERVPPPPGSTSLCPDAAMLFRYSALTFNAHRIHYDLGYAMAEEGYPERVVHGPLQATLLMNLAAAEYGQLSRFTFRGVRPGFVNAPLHLVGNTKPEGVALQTVNGAGEICMEATACCHVSEI